MFSISIGNNVSKGLTSKLSVLELKKNLISECKMMTIKN